MLDSVADPDTFGSEFIMSERDVKYYRDGSWSNFWHELKVVDKSWRKSKSFIHEIFCFQSRGFLSCLLSLNYVFKVEQKVIDKN